MDCLLSDAFLDRVGPLAYRTALECEVIEKTHWPPEVLDRCPSGRLQRYILYWQKKAERERRDVPS